MSEAMIAVAERSKEWLNTVETAAYIGVAVQTLNNWRHTGAVKIPFSRVGRLVRYSRRELDQFLENTKSVTTAECAAAGE